MPTHDYYCPTCGAERPDHFSPLYTLPEPRVSHGFVTTQDFDRPVHCGAPMAIVPPRVAIDAYEPFQAFQTEVLQPDGSHKPVTIDSLSKLRAVERDSEARARNGEGQAMVWRDYSQDRSNRDKHTLGESPAERPDPRVKAKIGKAIRSSDTPEVSLGPGVTEKTMSPFGGE